MHTYTDVVMVTLFGTVVVMESLSISKELSHSIPTISSSWEAPTYIPCGYFQSCPSLEIILPAVLSWGNFLSWKWLPGQHMYEVNPSHTSLIRYYENLFSLMEFG